MSGVRRFPAPSVGKTWARRWKNRAQRPITTPMRRILSGLAITVLIVSLAVVGYVINGWSWQDGLYMVVITIFGIGYGEVRPVDSPIERWLTIALIICGYSAIIYTVGGFAQILIDGELRRILGVRRMQREIDKLTGHVVICGFGRMGSKLAQALATRGKPLIVIDQDPQRVETARSHGCLAIQGNATEEDALRSAGIANASILTTVLSDDVANLFITITAHELNPNLEILARAEQSSTIKKLQQVGASRVILPANIGADRLANMILRPSAESLLQEAELPEGLNEDLASIGLRLDELEIQPGSPLIDGTLADLRGCSENTFLIVALRTAEGEVHLHPDAAEHLSQGDCVVILAHDADIVQLCTRFSLQSELPPASNEQLSEVGE